jgi:hypothetical protein
MPIDGRWRKPTLANMLAGAYILGSPHARLVYGVVRTTDPSNLCEPVRFLSCDNSSFGLAILFIFTLAAVSLLGLLAIHEAPFEPPVFVPPGPIIDVLRQVPM